ncbi:hypothetical protein [Roseovarius sp.]|uniref:hypothetical protein n=1 Tax=Roseovarius sp. TaxID=1486281 RepID=UPI003566D1EF
MRPLLPLILTLSACGGGGGGGSPATSEPPPPPDQAPPQSTPPPPEIALRDSLITTYTPLSYTPLALVPTTGSLTYNGTWGGTLSDRNDASTDSLLGRLKVTARFTASSLGIDGEVTGLTDAEGAPVGGTLTLSEGALDRAGDPFADATLTFAATGTLTDSAGRKLAVETRAEGDFLTDPAHAMGGEVLGRVIHEGRGQTMTGGFIAER